MGQAKEKLRSKKFWAFRLLDSIPLPIWVSCLLYGALVFAVILAALLITNADFSDDVYKRSLVLIPFLAGYMTALAPLVSRSAERMVDELAPVLKQGAPTARFKAESSGLSIWSILIWTLVFTVVSMTAQLLGIERNTPSEWVIFWARQYIFLHYTFYIFLYVKIRAIQTFIDEWVELDLNYIYEVRPVGRVGLGLALAVAIALAVVGVVQIFMQADSGVLIMSAIMSSPGYVLAALAVLLPSISILKMARRAKFRTRRALKEAMEQGKPYKTLQAELSGLQLLKYRDYIDSLPEWPFDQRATRGMIAFVVFPVVSWICAAFVSQSVRTVFFGS